MKKGIFTIMVVLFLANGLFAQGFSKESKNLNLGIGLGSTGIEGDATIPPISLGLQFGITDKISVGGIVGYEGSTYKFGMLGSSYEWKYSYIIVGARGEYHFLEPANKLDAYGGVTLGYQIASVSEPSNLPKFGISYSAKASALLFGFHAGARYAVSNGIAVFGELGYGISYLTIGANFKL